MTRQKRIEERSEPREVRCRHCGEPVWQGLIWVHRENESGRCPDGRAYAEPQVWVPWHPPGGSI